MLQPFVLLEQKHIDRLEKLKRPLLVTQTYTRGIGSLVKSDQVDILLSDYSDPGLAEMHKNAVRNDKYASIINLGNVDHYQKLIQMLEGNSYRLYWCVIESEAAIEKILNAYYKSKVRDYITHNTTWRISGNDKLGAQNIEVVFGELFVNLKWRTQRKRVELSEIEKY